MIHAVLCQVLPKQQNIVGLNNCRRERPDSTTQDGAQEEERGSSAGLQKGQITPLTSESESESVPFVAKRGEEKKGAGGEREKTL